MVRFRARLFFGQNEKGKMMRKPQSVRALETLGRVQLSPHFFMRDMLFSEIAVLSGLQNIPDDPDLAIKAGTQLCTKLLEPLQETFGPIAVRSAYRTPQINTYGNERNLSCASAKANYADHTWDRLDADGKMGAVATVVVPWFVPHYEAGADWRGLAWWVHDHLPYSTLYFFPKLAAFNIGWHEDPKRTIKSYINPRGTLTKPGMENHEGSHEDHWSWMYDKETPVNPPTYPLTKTTHDK